MFAGHAADHGLAAFQGKSGKAGEKIVIEKVVHFSENPESRIQNPDCY